MRMRMRLYIVTYKFKESTPEHQVNVIANSFSHDEEVFFQHDLRGRSKDDIILSIKRDIYALPEIS